MPAKKKPGPWGSLLLLLLIFGALYALYPHLRGLSQSKAQAAGAWLGPPRKATPAGELTLPKGLDRRLKPYVEQFIEGYQTVYSPEELEALQSEIGLVKMAEDRASLLIELRRVDPVSGKRGLTDLIFQRDGFGRYVSPPQALPTPLKLYVAQK